MYMYVCKHMYTYVYLCVGMHYAYVCMYQFIHVYIYTFVLCMNTYTYVYACVHVRMSACVYMHICMCFHVYVYIYLCVRHNSSFRFFRDRVSLYSSGWPGTHNVEQASIKLVQIHLPLPPKC